MNSSQHSSDSILTQSLLTNPQRNFLRLLSVILILWMVYRFLFFNIPIVLEESVGKLIFFGIPVWFYVVFTKKESVYNALNPKTKLKSGLFMGLAIGGLLGLVSTLAVIIGKSEVNIASLLVSPVFWGNFVLAIMTGFWESVFFFSFIFATFEKLFDDWNLTKILLVSVGLFTLFHLPNQLVRFDQLWHISFSSYIIAELLLVTLFAAGQALLYHQYRNTYLLTLTHAFWGMLLLVFT